MFELLPFDAAISKRFANDAPDTRRRARLISAFALLEVGGAALLVSTHLLRLTIPTWYAAVPVAAGLISLVVPLVVLRWKALRVGGHLCAACWLMVVGWGVFLRGGIMAPALFGLGAAPFIATMLLGRRAGLGWLVPVVAAFLLLVGLDVAGVTMTDRMPAEYARFSNWLAAALFSGLLVAIGMAQEWLRAKTNEELEAAERRKVAAEHEAELARADRLASLGQLAAGVAHELNNPLTYLQTNLELLEEYPMSADARASLDEAIEGTGRIKLIVRDLKEYSRFDDELGPVELHAVVRSGLRIASGELKRVTVLTDFGPCPSVHANETRLGQVVVNLLVNASQAGAREIAVSTRSDPSGNAVLAVRDTGEGIPPELLRRVREPFFTTKPAGVGTGLGLSVCDQLVRQFGGVMTIESTVGVGTTITLVLPPAPAESMASTG
jgi:signal transduction histidine kinase